MDEVATDKQMARKAAYARRKPAHGTGLDAAARENLLALLRRHPAQVIAGYMKIRTEIDPLPVMAELAAEGRRLCVPVIVGEGLPLAFREWTPGSALVDGPFGAVVPETGDWLEPEALIVPMLAFDRRGFRLGYGGGFYDRTLERLRAVRATLAVGFAYGAQETAAVPTEPTDERLDAVVTEDGVIRF
ncbi:5-formyltetrahydrofolate cyclo-ligase [Maritimibacter sp. 55A14]|uniref:5-formyltetrahydrofolate cyclo-ligase n=1 Tax=Maritimibacter sp. 55A14 TaxID=2174844 RepID=UPI000D616B20|nr:5-formyltetrahydrofolate cyclo-ligase [Maritimibacter sp. 55A14]PWE30528.1 5-formyltetrahydrofolate cyclo-ligase [Maritimibacter sp. 55A14]